MENEKKQINNTLTFQAHHVQPGRPAQTRLVSQLQKTQWMVRRGRSEAGGVLSSLHLPADLLEAGDLAVTGRVQHRPGLPVPASVQPRVEDAVLLHHRPELRVQGGQAEVSLICAVHSSDLTILAIERCCQYQLFFIRQIVIAEVNVQYSPHQWILQGAKQCQH